MIEKKIIAIPARLESSRLPNKVLKDIHGKPMIRHVLESCSKANDIEEVVLCTDNHKLLVNSKNWGFKSLLTSSACTSGSERISSVLEDLLNLAWSKEDLVINENNIDEIMAKTLIINVQGDQPLIDHNLITQLAENATKNFSEKFKVITPVHKLEKKEIHNPAVVKTLITKDWRVLYFSRSPLPYIRDVEREDWHKYYDYWGHVGVYGYRADVLKNWSLMGNSLLEDLEKLEQLRLVDNNYGIISFETDSQSISVDTQEQLDEVQKLFKERFP